jgi:uncharacterized protein YbjT (DUF2867 family)
MRILVTGATGYIGGRLVPLLVEGGHQVRVLVRDPGRIAGRDWAGRVELAVGDVEDPGSLRAACRDADAAYYLVHLMGSGRDFPERDRAAAHNIVAAAAGIGRVIYLGGLVPAGERISPHLASRAEVGEILRAGLPTLEFRAGPVIGSGSASFEMVRYLTERLPAMIAPRWILNQVQPIAVRDVLSYLMLSLERGEPGVYSIGGEPLSFKAMMEEFARARGLRRLIVPVPVLAPKLAALWVGLVTPIPNRLAVPLIEGVVHPVVADTSAARGTYPEVEPMPYPEAVRRALRTVEAGGVETRWSGALGGSPHVELAEVEGLIRESRRTWTPASCESVYRVLSSLGGDRGWLFWNWAWRLRGTLDRLTGGPGLRRGRRDPETLLPGDAVDFWRVEAADPPRLLRLRAEMNLPGQAWLQWEVEAENGGARLVQSALFAPKGLSGTLYWKALYPAHKIIFSGMVRRVAREATRPRPEE